MAQNTFKTQPPVNKCDIIVIDKMMRMTTYQLIKPPQAPPGIRG